MSFFVVSNNATAIGTEVCLSGTTAGGHITTPIQFTSRSEAETVAAALGDAWYVYPHPWPDQPSIGPAIFSHGYHDEASINGDDTGDDT